MLPTAFTRRTGTLLAAIAVLLIWATPIAAGATTVPSTIGITPVGTTAGYFTVTMAPGTSRQLAVKFSNPGESSAQASTYAADVYTIVNGGFGARLRGQSTTGVTNWLTYPSATISLGAGKAEERTFTVAVPDGTTPGEHVTSLVVQYQQPASTSGAVTLTEVSREALPIVIVVPGLITPALVLGAASQTIVDDRTDVSVAVTNPGNVRIHPAGQLVVSNDHGTQVATVNVKMGTVYPSDTTSASALLKILLPAGRYTVNAELADTTLGISANQASLVLNVPVAARPPTPAPTTRPAGTLGAVQPAAHIPVELIVGIIMASLLAGAAGMYGAAVFRRRKASSRTS